jgi:hypothetical protein
VAHLGVLDGDPPIAGHTLAKRRRQVWGHLHVLANDLPGGLQRGVGSRGSQLVVGDEALHLLQEAKHHPKRLVTRGRVSQSQSNAALTLAAPRAGTPASAATAAIPSVHGSPRPCCRAMTPNAVRRA